MSRPPWVVAVTGGIAAGKSAVTRRFADLGVPVHDADQAARAVVAPGTAGLAAVVEHFGTEVLDPQGGLDRAAMRQRIFTRAEARRELEAILHPRIRHWLQAAVQAQHHPYAMLAVPLLTEHHQDWRWVDRILLIDSAPELQRQRLLQRDGLATELADRMIASQSTPAARRAIADDVIENNHAEAALDAAVARLHRYYLDCAGA